MCGFKFFAEKATAPTTNQPASAVVTTPAPSGSAESASKAAPSSAAPVDAPRVHI